MRHLGTVIITLLAVFCIWSISFAAPINFEDFDNYGSPTVVADQESGTVTFAEEVDYDQQYFYNDYFLVPDDAIELSFDYSFTLGQEDNDYFLFEVNYAEVEEFTLDTTTTEVTTFVYDMTDFKGQEISLAWGLVRDWFDDSGIGSSAIISNIDLTTEKEQPAPVPEPGTILLLGSGLVGLASFRKRILK